MNLNWLLQEVSGLCWTCYFKVKKEGVMLKNQRISIHLFNSWMPQTSPRWVPVCSSSWIPAMESDGTAHVGKGTQGPGPARSVVQIKQFLVFLLIKKHFSFFLSLFYWSIVHLQCCVILLDGKVIQIYIPDTWILFHTLFHYGLLQDVCVCVCVCVCMCVCISCSVVSNSLWPHGL